MTPSDNQASCLGLNTLDISSAEVAMLGQNEASPLSLLYNIISSVQFTNVSMSSKIKEEL